MTGKPHLNDKSDRPQVRGATLDEGVLQNRMGEVGQEWASVESSLGLAGGLAGQKVDVSKEREGESNFMDISPFGWLMGGPAATALTPDRPASADKDAG